MGELKELKGKAAAVTGAASGIGRSTALLLAEEGCGCAIADNNEEGLRRTEKRIEEFGAPVHARVLDVSDMDAVYAWADDVVRMFGRLNLVVNSAGVSLSAGLEEMTCQDLEWLLGVNLYGTIYVTKAFLPYLKEANEGHVVNVSSVFGLVAVPNQSAYSTAKFGVRGFTECLRMELAASGCNVGATAVYPGGVKTGIARNARIYESLLEEAGVSREEMVEKFEKYARVSPDEAAAKIIKGIKKNKCRVLIGKDARLIDAVQRLMPVGFVCFLAWSSRAMGRSAGKRST